MEKIVLGFFGMCITDVFCGCFEDMSIKSFSPVLHGEAQGIFVLSWCVQLCEAKNDPRPFCSLQLEYTQLISTVEGKKKIKGHQNPQGPITPPMQCL